MTMYVKSDVKIESPYKFNSNFIINKCSLDAKIMENEQRQSVNLV